MSEKNLIRFVDLFAGVGGTRLAFEDTSTNCVFTSEWDKFSQITYSANFQSEHEIAGDIREVQSHEIPSHDILLAGFPCQPFSLAGVSKKNSLGRKHGFDDPTQGTLFFEVKRILEHHRPKAFLLENVKNLLSHDGGRTFQIIIETLTTELGYKVFWKVLTATPFVPQKRSRIFIVGFRDETSFEWPELRNELPPPVLSDILHREDGGELRTLGDGERFFDFDSHRVLDKYTLSPKLWEYLKSYAAKHRLAGNGFGYGLVGPNDVARTLSARYNKDGSEILISQGQSNPRRLTPRECARLMGFDDNFQIPVSDTQAYKQFGNSVVVPQVRLIAKSILKALR